MVSKHFSSGFPETNEKILGISYTNLKLIVKMQYYRL